MKKTREYAVDSPVKSKIQAIIARVIKTLVETERTLGVDKDATRQVQAMQRRCLVIECDLYVRNHNRHVLGDLKRRLANMQQRILVMKEKQAAGAGLFPTRRQTKLDKRPRSLFIYAVNGDVSAKAVLHNICVSALFEDGEVGGTESAVLREMKLLTLLLF